MKIELDLTENQLKDLDKGLEELIKSLTDEQKLELVRGYLEKSMDNIYYQRTDSFYSNSYKELSPFGKEITEGLQGKVKECITEKVLQNENIQDIINNTVRSLRNNLADIVQKSISTYIIEHLFQSKEQVNQDLDYAIQRYMCEHNPNNFR